MNTLIQFLQINLFLIVFFSFYWLVLRKETFYQLNRLYLWLAILFSFLLPFLKIETIKSWFVTERIQEVVYTASLPEAFVITSSVVPVFEWYEILEYGYIFVVFILSLRLIFNIYKSYSVTKSSDFIENNAFSFFGNSCVDSSLIESETIQYHEEIHSKQMHYLDLLLIEMVAILLWINPIVYYLKKQISLLHEFIADYHASQISNSKSDYATLLFSHQFNVQTSPVFVQPFFKQSTFKQRIIMLTKSPSQKIAILKYGIVAPLLVGMSVFCSVSCSSSADPLRIEETSVKVEDAKVLEVEKPEAEVKVAEQPQKAIKKLVIDQSKEDELFTEAEQKPEYKGGKAEMYKFIGNNIIYPKLAQRNNIKGSVLLKFIIEKDGSISNIEVEEGIGTGCEEESIRVIKLMPKWNPGKQNGRAVRVVYRMPIVFRLD